MASMIGQWRRRHVVFVIVLAAVVLLGVLGMHALALHGTQGGRHGAAHASAATPSHHTPSPDHTVQAAPAEHDEGAVAACVLALLGGLLLAVGLRWRVVAAEPVAPPGRAVAGRVALPRGPCLLELCISRR